jgi:Cu/Ag efflux protein CusF
MNRRLLGGLALIAALAVPSVVPAQSGGQPMQHGDMKSAAAMADGEIRKVDKDAGKLTIKHGPIPSMDMPPMTMVYRVKDPAMLDKMKPGDKVKFLAEKVGSAFTVMQIEPVQ